MSHHGFLNAHGLAPTQRNFRERQLDPTRPLPIWSSLDLKHNDYQNTNSCRGLSHQPKTGVDKDDEGEYHLNEILKRKLEHTTMMSSSVTETLGPQFSPNGHLAAHGHSHAHGHGHGHGHLGSHVGHPSDPTNLWRDHIKMKLNPGAGHRANGLGAADSGSNLKHIPIPETKMITDRSSNPKSFKRKSWQISKHYYKHNTLNSIIHESPPVYCSDREDASFVRATFMAIPEQLTATGLKGCKALSHSLAHSNSQSHSHSQPQATCNGSLPETPSSRGLSNGPRLPVHNSRHADANLEIFERMVDVYDNISSPYSVSMAPGSLRLQCQNKEVEFSIGLGVRTGWDIALYFNKNVLPGTLKNL